MTNWQHEAESQADAQTRAASFRNFANAAGAIVSVALVVGMGLWSYKLAVRDVSGVPVIRALEGPMRVAPDDPGGKQAAYQGLAVNAVAAEGVAAPLPERIVLAPPPVELDFADNDALVATGPDAAGRAETLWTEAALTLDAAEDMAQAGTAGDDDENTAAAVPADVPGVARSPLPRIRPVRDLVAETAARAASTALASERSIDIAPESLAPGTRLVQLGAYDDPEDARAEWQRLDARFDALLEDKSRVIQAAESGGRTFYRLRAHGFADEAEARRFCSVLLAESAGCIPVLIR